MKYLLLTLLAINLAFAEEKTETKATEGSKTYTESKNKICGEKFVNLEMSEDDFKKKAKEEIKEVTGELAGGLKEVNENRDKLKKSDQGKEILKDIKAGDKGELEKRPDAKLTKKVDKFKTKIENEDAAAVEKEKKDLADAKKTHPECMKTISKAMVGYKCVTQSKEGANQLKEVSTGQAQFTVNSDDAKELWKNCNFSLWPLCESIVLEEYVDNANGDKQEALKGRAQKLVDLCQSVADDANCTDTTLDKCGDTVVNGFASVILVVGNRSHSFFGKSMRDKRKDMREKREKKTPPKKGGASSGTKTETKGDATKSDGTKTARILIARFLESGNEGSEVEVVVSSSGESLIQVAAKSALDTNTIWESVKVLATGLLTAFFVIMIK